MMDEGSIEHQKGRKSNRKSESMSKFIHVPSPFVFSKLCLLHGTKSITRLFSSMYVKEIFMKITLQMGEVSYTSLEW